MLKSGTSFDFANALARVSSLSNLRLCHFVGSLAQAELSVAAHTMLTFPSESK